MPVSSPMLVCSLRGRWWSMTALRLLIGQPASGPERSWSAPRLIPKQGQLHDLRAWRNCRLSSDDGREVVSRSGIPPSMCPFREGT